MRLTSRSATNAAVTTGRGLTEGGGEENAASGYDAVRADDSIQFSPITEPEKPEPSGWLEDFFRWLGELLEPVGQMFGASWFIVKWVLLAAAVALLLYLLWKLLAPVLDLRRSSKPAETEDWVPAEKEALALLDEADRLAAAGQYDAATHLLLKRSVGHIAAARPDWVDPSSTARELAVLPSLPLAARTAFATIADRVERSLFALKRLGAEDWQAARSAYAEFALQRLNGDAR